MATLTNVIPALAGAAFSPVAAAAGGDQFLNDGRTALYVKNGGSAVTVTITPQGTADGLAIQNIAVSVPAGQERLIGLFPTRFFNNGSGFVLVTYSAVTSVTVATVDLP